MTRQAVPLPWAEPDWLENAGAWIDAQLLANGLRRNSAIEQPHSYPWSIVLRIPTTQGPVWFKAPVPIAAYEVAITQALAAWHPDYMVELLAADAARGWMLMRDAGTPLRAHIRPNKDLRPWREVLPRYAELQVALGERVPELLALGAPDRRLAQLPAHLEQLLADKGMLRLDKSPGLSSAEYRRLQELAPRLRAECDELEAFNIPASLNHGDLHDGNVLVGTGRTIFFDWGDCSLTHPFISLRTVFVSIENSLELADYTFSPEMAALRDLYLEPWTRFAPREKLRAAADLARRLAPIVGALGWHMVIATANDAAREKYAAPVPELLQEYLQLEDTHSQRPG